MTKKTMNPNPSQESKPGRPNRYDRSLPPSRIAYSFARLGATDEEIASVLGVSRDTIGRWKKTRPEFAEALRRGKSEADARVACSLFERACGYSHLAVKFFVSQGKLKEAKYIEHYPPDTTACIFWLKNRRPDLWRDTHRNEHLDASGNSGENNCCNLEQLRAELTKQGPLPEESKG